MLPVLLTVVFFFSYKKASSAGECYLEELFLSIPI